MTDLTPGQNTPQTEAQVVASAEKELTGLFRGEEAPAPVVETAPPQPAEQPVAPPAAAPVPPAPADGAPVVAAPAQPLASQPALAGPEDPVQKKVQDIFGTDPQRAAQAILETNNRAASMATKLRELGIDPKTMQPVAQAPTVVPSAVPPPPITPVQDPKLYDAEVNRLLDGDPNFVSLVQTWMESDSRRKAIASEASTLKSEVQKISLALELPQVKADQFAADQYAQDLATKRTQLLQLQLEDNVLEAKQERLNSTAARFTERARTAVSQHYENESRKQREEFELAQYQREAYAEYSTSWPLALERAVVEAKIPQELVEDFKEDAKMAALAFLQNSEKPIDDVYAFTANRAKVLMDRLDRFHRMQSASYGAQATARASLATASVPSAPASPAAASPSTPTQTHPSLAAHERALEQEAALVARQLGLF